LILSEKAVKRGSINLYMKKSPCNWAGAGEVEI
jgi:hypothetical protein